MQVYQVKDIEENNYYIVRQEDFLMMENDPFHKDDYFGYINKDNKFISCEKHRDKQPKALFVVHHNSEMINCISPKRNKNRKIL